MSREKQNTPTNTPTCTNLHQPCNRVQVEVITYEEERLNYFTDLMEKAQKRYKRLFKKFKDAPYLSVESEMLSDAGRETQFHHDVVEMLEKGYRKQSENMVEVVRCKDCKYFLKGKIANETTYFCDKGVGMIDVAPDCYCSYGEQR